MASPQEIVLEDITTKEINGTGAFDHLMQAVDRHLLEEYSKNRIRGNDYANVYVGGLGAVLQQSIGFILGKQEAEMKALLIEAQIKAIDSDIVKTAQEILVLKAQIEKIDAEILLTLQQIKISELQAVNIAFEGEKLQAETRLIDQNILNAQTQRDVLIQQKAKIAMETHLLEEKRFSEQAQRLDTVDGEPVTGMIGVQKSLYKRQANGFIRNAEQKLAKIYTDAYNVRQGVSDLTTPGEAGLGESDIQNILSIARGGINPDKPENQDIT